MSDDMKCGEVQPAVPPAGPGPFARFFANELRKHRQAAHAFVDELFDNEGIDGSNNAWRRLLSAMMEDHRRWQTRDKSQKFLPAMNIPLGDMEAISEEESES